MEWKGVRYRMMKNIISLILLIAGSAAIAQSSNSTRVKYDTSEVKVRHFDQQAVDEYKANKEFDYGTQPKADLTLWQRFKIWLSEVLRGIFYFGTETPIGKVIVYIIIGAVLVYTIMKILKIDTSGMFLPGPKQSSLLDHGLHHENIHEMDFEALITEAIQNKDYKSAIRLNYLWALKKLSDRDLVHWVPGKTNHEYVSELTGTAAREGFNDLSYYFDYAWYGDFSVDENLYKKVSTIFSNWNAQL